ncbi:MAG: glucose-6-phosphate isomerase [Anaerolineae bacterium]
MNDLTQHFTLQTENILLSAGRFQTEYDRALAQLQARQAVLRIWEKDATLWRTEPDHIREISNRLGWLTLPETMSLEVGALRQYAEHARAVGLKRTVHLGMGGSSLAPEVLRLVLGCVPGHLDLAVLDSTDPAQIRRIEAGGPLEETLFIVASKSGTTAETANLYTYFRGRVSQVLGEPAVKDHFCVITDPGTALEVLARDESLCLFTNPADIGGRFSALSLFGLVPAALLGLDLEAILASGALLARACGTERAALENPGLLLGALLGGAAQRVQVPGDKLTLLSSPEIRPFGAWVEQLVAESTGKEGVGILPVVDEDPLPAAEYGPDRVFVYMRLEGSNNAKSDALVKELVTMGAPVAVLPMKNAYELGGQFMLWEFATAVAGAVLRIDPFDQPNVEAAKIQARSALQRYQETHALEIGEPTLTEPPLAFYGQHANDEHSVDFLARFIEHSDAHGYIALMAYIDRTPAYEDLLSSLARILTQRMNLPITIGFGPRFLHSTGQLHKGGPNTGTFIQFVQTEVNDLPIPGRSYSFGILKRSQALGDLAALQAAGRRVLCVDLGSDVTAGLAKFRELILGGEYDAHTAGDAPCQKCLE